ncbi:MAG: hypothetical protein WBL31_15565, partial [Ilumatobacteraceae bacterium]
MAIACAYCNGEHGSPAEVRQCWLDNGRQEVPVSGDDPLPFDDGGTAEEPVAAVAPARDIPRGVAAAGAGPDALGRHLVIEPGGAVP